MASESKAQLTRKTRYVLFHKLAAGLSLVAFVVVIVGGFMEGVGIMTITWRACIVMIAISFITRILMRVWATLEEAKGG
ncbi:MAG: hypothetical protein KDD53_11255 [Bdellovibrionales bacterium]|nr:hypothetical protein [Bdellovibrionales bacterium]